MRTIPRHILLIACLAVLSSSTAFAQYENFGTLDYTNLSVNRIAPVPQVTWVTTGATLDENHGRYFFQGNSSQAPPWFLFTIDVATGATISNPKVPSNFSNGSVDGLQYDNGKDTLYCIYLDGTGGGSFAWISPADGVVHLIKTIPGFSGITSSTFDKTHHVYILLTGALLIAIDAATGTILHQSAPGTNLFQLVYDNSNGYLYGIATSFTLPSPQFDSVTLATGVTHRISDIPPMTLPQINAYAIDEGAGKYFFVGGDPPGTACPNNYLYVVDIHNGAVLSKTVYPYAQDPSGVNQENVIYYTFDNPSHNLYVLNWFPPAGWNPFVTITVSSNPVCPGETMTFTANPELGVLNPSYQWFVNGVNTGMTGQTYSRNDLVGGDTVFCAITIQAPCSMAATDTSNKIGILSNTSLAASVSISAGATGVVCANDAITFTAVPTFGGITPTYQWQVNGNPAGTNSPSFTNTGWTNGDVVNCIMTSSSGCVVQKQVISNDVVMQVSTVSPSLVIDVASTTVCSGDTVEFTANPTNGGSLPHYQWQVDGNNTGGDNAVFITHSLADGDKISCIMTGSLTCSAPVSSTNTITMTVNPSPTVSLDANFFITRGKNIILNPSITGVIVQTQWTPPMGLSNPDIADPIASPDTTTVYLLHVTDNNSCTTTAKTTINVIYTLQMPNAFTPNGDGKNDLFRIPPSTPVKIIGFTVYNRWGQMVFFTTNSYRGWDGIFNGQPQPAGSYVWKIEYQDARGVVKAASGTVILVR